jgi:hypothetical protein
MGVSRSEIGYTKYLLENAEAIELDSLTISLTSTSRVSTAMGAAETRPEKCQESLIVSYYRRRNLRPTGNEGDNSEDLELHTRNLENA